jgi:hypothetical protein
VWLTLYSGNHGYGTETACRQRYHWSYTRKRRRLDISTCQTYPAYNPLPSILETPTPPIIAETAEGEAIIEVRFLHNNYNSSSIADCVQTYTVDFNRNNEPTLGHVVGRLKCSGHRFLANHGDATTLKRLASRSEEPIGQSGYVRASGGADGRNLFFLEAGPRL